jgi:hypothetical protein
MDRVNPKSMPRKESSSEKIYVASSGMMRGMDDDLV